jgi:hypothetical protein
MVGPVNILDSGQRQFGNTMISDATTQIHVTCGILTYLKAGGQGNCTRIDRFLKALLVSFVEFGVNDQTQEKV